LRHGHEVDRQPIRYRLQKSDQFDEFGRCFVEHDDEAKRASQKGLFERCMEVVGIERAGLIVRANCVGGACV